MARMEGIDLRPKDKIFAIYFDNVFYGAVLIRADEEQRRVLALMEAAKRSAKSGSEIAIKEAITIPFELAIHRLRTGRPDAQ